MSEGDDEDGGEYKELKEKEKEEEEEEEEGRNTEVSGWGGKFIVEVR